MCLDTVDEKPRVTEGEGWKVFSTGKGHELAGVCFDFPFVEGRWLRDRPGRRWGLDYPPGFHLYATRSTAYRDRLNGDEEVRRVSFRLVTVTGSTGRRKIIVAREIYIHPKGM